MHYKMGEGFRQGGLEHRGYSEGAYTGARVLGERRSRSTSSKKSTLADNGRRTPRDLLEYAFIYQHLWALVLRFRIRDVHRGQCMVRPCGRGIVERLRRTTECTSDDDEPRWRVRIILGARWIGARRFAGRPHFFGVMRFILIRRECCREGLSDHESEDKEDGTEIGIQAIDGNDCMRNETTLAVMPDCDVNVSIEYWGCVPLLGMRGGGKTSTDLETESSAGPPAGAGVLAWLNDDPELIRREAEFLTILRNQSVHGSEADGGNDGLRQCGSAEDLVNFDGDDSKDPQRAIDDCDVTAAAVEQPDESTRILAETAACEEDTQPQRREISIWEALGDPVPISIWEALGLDDPGGHEGVIASWDAAWRPRSRAFAAQAESGAVRPVAISGRRGERPVMVCMGCYRDVDLERDGAASCACGVHLCSSCTAYGCPRCGTTCRIERKASPPVDHGYNMFELEFQGDLSDDGADMALPPPTAVGLDDSALVCSRCAVGSRDRCLAWRICRCSAVSCENCVAEPCIQCGAISGYAGSSGLPVAGARAHDDHEDEVGYDVREDGSGDIDESDHEEDEDAVLWEDFGAAYVPQPFDGDFLHVAGRLTPGQAAHRRDEITRNMREQRAQRRVEDRRRRKEQIRRGSRPAERRRFRPDVVAFGTANVTSSTAWKEEMDYGEVLPRLDVVAIQEHKLGTEEDRQAAGSALRAAGWDPQIDPPYWKTAGYGGGTAIITREGDGALPTPLSDASMAGERASYLKGRVSFSNLPVLGGILFGAVYGLSGQGVAAQIRFWRYIAEEIRLTGLPFVLAGDWQTAPADMASSGFLDLIGAVLAVPAEATNINAGSTIDHGGQSLAWHSAHSPRPRHPVYAGGSFAWHVMAGGAAPRPSGRQAYWTSPRGTGSRLERMGNEAA